MIKVAMAAPVIANPCEKANIPREWTQGYQANPTQTYTASSSTSPVDVSSSVSMTGQMDSMSLKDPGNTPKYTVSSTYTATGGQTQKTNLSTYPGVAGYSYDKTINPAQTGANQYGTNYGDQSGGGDMSTTSQTDNRTSQSPAHRYIAGTSGEKEKLDSRYQVRNHDYKKFFRPGRVFSTLWTVPASGKTNNNETFISVVKFGEKVHTKIRRFVVVKQKNHRCTCLPVTSYEGRGYKKPDIDLAEHGFIYSSKRPKNISEITKKALKVSLSKGAEPLRDPSLINYGCMYTVETNVKVMDVGTLEADSLGLLDLYYNEVNHSGITDSKPQRDESDLTGVGAGFSSGGQSYGSGTRGGYMSPTMHDRTSSFGSQPSSHNTSDTYRVSVAGSSGYTATSGYSAQPTMTTGVAGYPSQDVSSSRYAASPTSPTDSRYPSTTVGGNTFTTTYKTAEPSSSNPRFSPRSDVSGNPGHYTTQPPYTSTSSQFSTHYPTDDYPSEHPDDQPLTSRYTSNVPYSSLGGTDETPGGYPADNIREGNTYPSSATNPRGKEVSYSSSHPSDYSSSTPRGSSNYLPSSSNPRGKETSYPSSHPTGGQTAHGSSATPLPTRTSQGEPVSRDDNDDEDLDDGRDIILPTPEQVQASHPPRPRHRESDSRSTRYHGRDGRDGRERHREETREKTSSSRHHGRSDRERRDRR